MNINYERTKVNYKRFIKLDDKKLNILILGAGNSDIERCNIINPVNTSNALELFGESDLFNAYKYAKDITNDYNVYVCNCTTNTDYITVSDKIIQYEFDYIVPVSIYLSDTFYNPITKQYEYYTNYFLNVLKEVNSIATLIMTDKHASLYEDIDFFLNDMRIKYKSYINNKDTLNILSKSGSNLVLVYNMLNNISHANIIVAAMLASNTGYTYPSNVDYYPTYDLDKNDIINSNFVYFKYNYLTNNTSTENLLNLRTINDIYKNILINELIKKVIKIVDLNEYRGKLYTNYTQLQIANKIKLLLNPYKNVLFLDYKINNINFVKTAPGVGYIYVELSISPYSSIDNINLVMEV